MTAPVETRNTTWGDDVRISRVGPYRLVHLDAPDDRTIETRIRMVEDGSFFDADCPICQAQKKAGGDIVFEPEWDGLEAESRTYDPEREDGDAGTTPDPSRPIWRRTYLDLDSLEELGAREEVHALSTAITFCLIELSDDVSLLGEAERWGESLRYYCACFARYSPALCGSDRLNHAEARNLGALVFQLRSYLGWFAESTPVLDRKCSDLDGICARTLAGLRRFDDGERAPEDVAS